MATDVDLYDNHVGGSIECFEAVLGDPDPEALPMTLDARLDTEQTQLMHLEAGGGS